VGVSAQTRQQGADRVTTVTLRNLGNTLAFAVHLAVNRGDGGEEILPVLWEDNYFPLLPAETRRVSATYSARDLGAAVPVVVAEAWNLKPKTAQ
jgi:exo-1,4-beta-D-glucosaminidase